MFRLELQEGRKRDWKLPLLTDYVKKWADITPDNIALISADTGQSYTYREFDDMITLYALQLRKMGVGRGDVVVAQWLAFPEFYILTYACATIGARYTSSVTGQARQWPVIPPPTLPRTPDSIPRCFQICR